jgi:tRNA pseudouridine32 synthase / 23S rRNA pseudouridine746 synthase
LRSTMDAIPFGDQSIPILFESDDLIALDKPVGLASIPERNPQNASLLAVLTAARRQKFYVVHRLDKQVSGVILFAKTPEFHRYLNLQFQHRRVLKSYLAVVHGQLSHGGRIETPLRRFGSGRMAVDPETGKACLTEYDILDCRPETTLLRVRPLTGRKHQIRAHLFGIGHPIVGDPLYGDKSFQRSFPRLMLHASSIRFVLPAGGEIQIESPTAEAFTVLPLIHHSAV